MKFAYSSDGLEVRLNQEGVHPMLTGNCENSERVWGMVNEYYTAPEGVLTPKTQSEIDTIVSEELLVTNSAKAAKAQLDTIKELEEEVLLSKYKLPPKMSEEDKGIREEQVKLLQGDIDNPSDSAVYSPPLPPGVTPPTYGTLTVTVTREEGWQGALGWRAVISSMSKDFVPTSLALSVHTGAECDGYKYTTGAFVHDEVKDEWYSVCPAGQEPGDAIEHFGVLYGAAPLGCFTLQAGAPATVAVVYGEDVPKNVKLKKVK